jgi:hypothetical protein
MSVEPQGFYGYLDRAPASSAGVVGKTDWANVLGNAVGTFEAEAARAAAEVSRLVEQARSAIAFLRNELAAAEASQLAPGEPSTHKEYRVQAARERLTENRSAWRGRIAPAQREAAHWAAKADGARRGRLTITDFDRESAGWLDEHRALVNAAYESGRAENVTLEQMSGADVG